MHTDLEHSVSRTSHSNVPPRELLADEADAELLGMSDNQLYLSRLLMIV